MLHMFDCRICYVYNSLNNKAPLCVCSEIHTITITYMDMDIHLYMYCILNTLTILILYKEYSKQSFKFSMESWALHGK